MELEEELDFEEQDEDYANDIIYGQSCDLPNQEVNHQKNCTNDTQSGQQIDNQLSGNPSNEEIDRRTHENNQPIGEKINKKLKNKHKTIERKNKSSSDMSFNKSNDSKRNETKNSKEKNKKRHKSRTKDSAENPFEKQNSLKTKCNELMSEPVMSSAKAPSPERTNLKTSERATNESQIEDSNVFTNNENSSQDSDKYDVKGVCEPCFVILYNTSDQFIRHAKKGEIIFEVIEENEDTNQMTSTTNETQIAIPCLSDKFCEDTVGPADGLEAHITNLCQPFEELTNESNKNQSNPSETQSALLGLMDDQFADDNRGNDLMATALHLPLNGEIDGTDVSTSIPDPEVNANNQKDLLSTIVDIALNGDEDYLIF